MKKYIVKIIETKEYSYEVEASNSYDAEDKASSLFREEHGNGDEQAKYTSNVIQPTDMADEELEDKIDNLIENVREIEQHLEYSNSSEGLREKSLLLEEISVLTHQLKNRKK